MTEHYNQLTPAQAEALAILAEECGETIQIIGKILRHGKDSHHPGDKEKMPNWMLLSIELGHINAAVELCTAQYIVTNNAVADSCSEKLERIKRYLHHIELEPKVFEKEEA